VKEGERKKETHTYLHTSGSGKNRERSVAKTRQTLYPERRKRRRSSKEVRGKKRQRLSKEGRETKIA